jgi:hypothetical protein
VDIWCINYAEMPWKVNGFSDEVVNGWPES